MRGGVSVFSRVVVHESMHRRIEPFKRFMFYKHYKRFSSFVL